MDSPCALKGFALGKLLLSSGLLDISWRKISESPPNQDLGLEIKTYEETKYTIVVFVARPICRESSPPTPLSGRSSDQNRFHFLCSEKTFSFSLHTPAFQLFDSACDTKLPQLEELRKSVKPLIITGAGLGGSVASLFTLMLLKNIDPKLKLPLCITFGSPLIGDASLQQVLENSVRNSCFLHVADDATHINAVDFKPFGTYLICFDSECICIEDPEAVMELLVGVDEDWKDYGEILGHFDSSVMVDSRLMIDDVIDRMEERAETKKQRHDKFKQQLIDIKISMVYMEWYKKECKKFKICYYDRFKTQRLSPNTELDIKIEYHKIKLNRYWEAVVEEVENKPQSDTSILTRRFLFSGYNYRRMVEPLNIAEYYFNGGKEYRSRERSHHYVMLEKWFKAAKLKPKRRENEDLSVLLTFDSCFWAEVEESLILSNLLKTSVGMGDDEKEALTGKLLMFEEYVWGLIQEREVSPEIFLENSSFMRWWKEYKEISPPSDFTKYMITRGYESYGQPIKE